MMIICLLFFKKKVLFFSSNINGICVLIMMNGYQFMFSLLMFLNSKKYRLKIIQFECDKWLLPATMS